MHPAAIKNTVEASLAGQSYVTKAVIVLLIFFWIISKWSSWAYEMLAVAPGTIGPPRMHVWSLVTGGLVEENIVLLAIDIVALSGAGGQFEPLWGTLEYAKFLVVVTMGTTLGSAMWYIFMYALSTDTNVLFFYYGGFWGVLCGYLVAFKQAFPQRRLPLAGFIVLEARHGPLVFIAITYGMYIGNIVKGHCPVMATCGLLTSWLYLRFYQEKDGGKGDGTENFGFSDFFPTPLQPIVNILSGRVFKFAVAIKLCSKKPTQYDMSAPSSIKIALPGVTSSDADRRRQIALRDLSARTSRPNTAGDQDVSQESTNPSPASDQNHSNTVVEIDGDTSNGQVDASTAE